MDENSSDSSVVEIEIEKKFPPIIHLDEEEIMLNVNVPSVPCVDPIGTSAVGPEGFSLGKNEKGNNPDHWTKDMIKFYDDDWGDEESFAVKKIQEKMNKDPHLWKISNKDILSAHSKRRPSNIKCWNCCQHGHTASDCPDPLHEIKCHMCGGAGHEGRNCPNSKCLNCGGGSRTFVQMCPKCIKELKTKCSRCNVEGHYFINCTDHWRKYHYTTQTKDVRRPEHNVNKPSDQLWCSNCGRRGHHQTRCGSKRNSISYPDSLPFISSYGDLFAENTEIGAAKKRRYFEEDSAGREKGLSWPEKVDSVIQCRDKSSDEVTVLFERKEKRPADNPFRNWEDWFARGRRKNKNKNKNRGKREKKMGNYAETHRGSFGSEIKRMTKNRKEMFIRGNNKRAMRQSDNR